MSDGPIDIWDAATGQRVRQFQSNRFPSVALSPDGKTAAVLAFRNKDESSLYLWDVPTGKELHRLVGHTDRIHALLFSHDGKMLVTSSDDRSVRLWDTATGKQVRRFDHAERVGQVALSPDGKTLASVSAFKNTSTDGEGTATFWEAGKTVTLWDVTSGKEMHRLEGHGQNGVGALALSPDSRLLVSCDWHTTHVWDVATGQKLPRRALPAERGVAMAFAPDGKTLVTGGSSSFVRLWDMDTGREQIPARGHGSEVHATAISPDGRTLATGCADKVIRLWDANGKLQRQLAGHENLIWSLTFSAAGRRLVSIGWDSTTRLWDVATGKERRRFSAQNSALSADGSVLIGSTEDKLIHVWDMTTGNELRSWQALVKGLFQLGLSPDGRTAFSLDTEPLSQVTTVRLWDAAAGKEPRRFVVRPFGEDSRIYCSAFSPDGKFVAFGGQMNYVVLYDMATGKQAKRLTGLPYAVSSLAFSPDSRLLVSGDWDSGTVHVFEVATGQEFRKFAGHQGRAFNMAFSSDGALLLTGNADTTALLWDILGRHTKPLAGPLSAKDLEAKLIADVGSATFSVRERAIAELESLGEAAEPDVRKALGAQPPLEVRQRLRRFLDNLQGAQRLRALRALQILELIGSSESRRLVEALAKGAPGAWLTNEARATWDRLAKRVP